MGDKLFERKKLKTNEVKLPKQTYIQKHGYDDQGLTVADGGLFCQFCLIPVIFKKNVIEDHLGTLKHAKKREKLKSERILSNYFFSPFTYRTQRENNQRFFNYREMPRKE